MDLSIIKEIRTQLNISRKDLATAVGVSPAYIQQIEANKKNPSLSTLKKISSALSIPLDEILQRDMIQDYENNLSAFFINNLAPDKPYDDFSELEKNLVDRIYELYKAKEEVENEFSHDMKLKELSYFYPKQINIYKALLSKMAEYNTYLIGKSNLLEEYNNDLEKKYNELNEKFDTLNNNLSKVLSKLDCL